MLFCGMRQVMALLGAVAIQTILVVRVLMLIDMVLVSLRSFWLQLPFTFGFKGSHGFGNRNQNPPIPTHEIVPSVMSPYTSVIFPASNLTDFKTF